MLCVRSGLAVGVLQVLLFLSLERETYFYRHLLCGMKPPISGKRSGLLGAHRCVAITSRTRVRVHRRKCSFLALLDRTSSGRKVPFGLGPRAGVGGGFFRGTF